jgi:hypothetical protein
MLSMCADLPPPVPQPVPRTILFQRKRANRRILNEHMFLNVLREFGEVGATVNMPLAAGFQIYNATVPVVLLMHALR